MPAEDFVDAIVGLIILTIVALMSLAILDAFAQVESLQTPQGREILDSAATAIVLIAVIGASGVGIIIRLMSELS